MDSSVARTRHIITLIVAVSITWQSLVPCECELCCHAVADATSNDIDSEVSPSGCSHSAHHPDSSKHTSKATRTDGSGGFLSGDREPQHFPCHRFAGMTTSNKSIADSVLAWAILTAPGNGTPHVLGTSKLSHCLQTNGVTHVRLDPGAVLRLQV